MPGKTFHYYLLYKPYGYLSQFTADHPGQLTLSDCCHGLAKDVFPVGRLDKDSEGLLLLTNDKRVNHRLLDPVYRHNRTYQVQVEGVPTAEALQQLAAGPEIKVNKQWYKSLPCAVRLLEAPPEVPPREPPVRFRKTVPDSWLELTLQEGKNRQVRKMCAAVGYPVLRLIRTQVEGIRLHPLQPGDLVEISQSGFYKKLKLSPR